MNTIKSALGLGHEAESEQSGEHKEPQQSAPAQHEPAQAEPSAKPERNDNAEHKRKDNNGPEQKAKDMSKTTSTGERHRAPAVSSNAMKGNNDGSQLAPGEIPCPDPSVHQHDTQLQEQASKAALLATHPEQLHGKWPLDSDNKLSSAGAATSLRHARPQDLPSFPVVGIDTQSSAGTAATLANANKKSFEYWKPNPSSSAGKAAMLAKDYKMAPLWHAETSAAGSKAALLAAKEGPKLNLWQPEAHPEGNSAANIAMRMKGLSPELDYGYTQDGHKRALVAATGALSNSQRRRAGSQPTPVELYPDQANAKYNALNAATSSARDAGRLGSPAMEAARVKNLGHNVPREMFTEHPPVAIEVEEKRHQEALRASAISMAKQMYALQQRHIEEAASADGYTAAGSAYGRQPSTSSQDIKQQAMQYINLQEHAQKLAAERLAKLNPDEAQVYRQYYGYSMEPPRSRLSLRGRGRRRASSESGLAAEDDVEQSRKIRSQMSQFNTQLAQVDAKKQRADRESLMAAAERRVQARMHDLDERVFMETGKVPPAMMEEWERKARERAAADSQARMANHGKVHVGGGKFMDQSEIDAIAAARLQPTFDEITEKAERQRALDEERRLDEEQRKREALKEKQRAAETKAEQKRMREEEKLAAKARKREEKQAAKAGKVAEKAKVAEETRMQDEAQRGSAEVERVATTTTAESVSSSDVEDAARAAGTKAPVARSRDSSVSRSLTGSDAEVVAHRVLTAPVVSEDVPPILPTTEDAATTVVDKAAAEKLADLVADPSEVARVSTDVAPTTGTATTAAVVPIKAAAPAPASQPKQQRSASPTRTDSKGGLKGLLGKLKRRSKAPAPTSTSTTTATEPRISTASSHKDASPGTASPRHTANTAEPITTTTATTTAPGATAAAAGGSRASSPVSSLSSSSLSDDNELEARGRSGRRLSDSSDEFEEARDTFDDRLAPPPSFGNKGSKTESPIRDSKFQEAL